MSLGETLAAEVQNVLTSKWTERDGRIVPESSDIRLGNDAVKLDGTVLYADMAGSTELVDGYKPWFAAAVYKCFLYCAAKIVRSEGGEITSYDGDRIMAVFLGDAKNSSAARAALKINYATKNIVTPAFHSRYPKSKYSVKHAVGIDTSSLFVARTGIRGSNDLVWVGRSANYAAKLTELSSDYASRITDAVYSLLNKEARIGADGRPMWERMRWTDMGGITIYRSTWWWKV